MTPKVSRKKAELVEAVAAVEVIPGDEEGNEADYGEDEQEAKPEQISE